MSEYDDGWEAGKKAAARELQPLVDAITDAIFMFNDIQKARQLPATAQAVQQYNAMGRELERCLKLSGLLNVQQSDNEEYERRKAAWIAQRT